MKIMNNIQVISKKSVIQNELLFGSSAHTGYLWENLAIEKRVSSSLINKLYKGSIVDAFWTVLSSPVS